MATSTRGRITPTEKRTDPQQTIPGWGVDLENRPGVPEEWDPPRKLGDAHWDAPDRQKAEARVLKRADLKDLTPAFGTMQPPRGLSGALKRAAYQIPDHRPAHWLVLMASDRVDVLESAFRAPHQSVGTLVKLGAFALGVWAVFKVKRALN